MLSLLSIIICKYKLKLVVPFESRDDRISYNVLICIYHPHFELYNITKLMQTIMPILATYCIIYINIYFYMKCICRSQTVLFNMISQAILYSLT